MLETALARQINFLRLYLFPCILSSAPPTLRLLRDFPVLDSLSLSLCWMPFLFFFSERFWPYPV